MPSQDLQGPTAVAAGDLLPQKHATVRNKIEVLAARADPLGCLLSLGIG
jgi:hypothetical protein